MERRVMRARGGSLPAPELRSPEGRPLWLYARMPFTTLPAIPVGPGVRALELYGQALVVDAQQMRHGGMEIGHGHRVLDRGVA
jgi:hypothetical protein